MLMQNANPKKNMQFRAVELFAGVGGFRIGLESSGWDIVLSNQWEPGSKKQHASECYVARFGADGHICRDITSVLDDAEEGLFDIPDHELLVGGFPCQDYSVAKSANQAKGIEGKKGVLWWQIYRLLELKRPPYVLLENVDRLLKSPSSHRGRDFAIILSCFAELGYSVEWRVINAADYGFPQKRRRVFIAAYLDSNTSFTDPSALLTGEGILAKAFPVVSDKSNKRLDDPFKDLPLESFNLSSDIFEVSEKFGLGSKISPFRNSGFMRGRAVWTDDLIPDYSGEHVTLGDILVPDSEIPKEFCVPRSQIKTWKYLKGAKREERRHKGSGTVYYYTEGALPFPDPIDRPARTILTGEGGTSPSRFKHIIKYKSNSYRRLTPIELERLNGFADDWTNTGMPDGRRAFCMGNALVVGVVESICKTIFEGISSLGSLDVEDINEKTTEERLLTSAAGGAT